MAFSAEESDACHLLIQMALEEDLGQAGDVTSKAVIPEELQGKAVFVARSPGVLAGLPAAQMVFQAVDSRLAFAPRKVDGAALTKGDCLAEVAGPIRGILAAERSALNFLQHLSGIATLTRRYVDATAGLTCQILDTRKTLPGWRLLAKYAVRRGGGHNHRMGLYDGILIKDNHLAFLNEWESSRSANLVASREAIRLARKYLGTDFPLEIEVDSLAQLEDVLDLAPAIVLLDNMDLAGLRAAVKRRNERAPKVLLEASGGVNLDTVRSIAETGVDRISVGALTHSAPALDIALDYQPP